MLKKQKCNGKYSHVSIEDFLEEYFKITGTYTISDNGIIDVDGNIQVNFEKI